MRAQNLIQESGVSKRTQEELKTATIVLVITMALAFLANCSPAPIEKIEQDFTRDVAQDIRLDEIESSVQLLRQQYVNLYDSHNIMFLQVQALESQSAQTAAQLVNIQNAANATQATLTQITLGVQILDIVDLCGDGPGFDEVIMRTNKGYVAYFQDGNNRHLVILPENIPLASTDSQQCHFQIVNGQVVY